jgi:hypothetical protein
MGKVLAIPARRRSLTYAALLLGLLVGRVVLGHAAWSGNAEIHTLLETTATVLAFIMGAMALVRYYSQKAGSYLMLGSGFLGAGLLDGYHVVVTSSFCSDCTPSALAVITPWTGVVSRIFLSILICIGLFVWRSETDGPRASRIRERTVYLLVGGWTLASFVFFLWAPLPQAYQPQWPVHRPAELIAGFFFAIAALGYWRKGDWRANWFDHYLMLCLIASALSHLVYMPFSGKLFDALYVTAHILKVLGYIFVLHGLLHSMFTVFAHEAEVVCNLTRANASLASEVEERQRAENALQQSRDDLEARVAARTAALAEANAELLKARIKLTPPTAQKASFWPT